VICGERIPGRVEFLAKPPRKEKAGPVERWPVWLRLERRSASSGRPPSHGKEWGFILSTTGEFEAGK
jgi:hypothetical protein